MIRFGCPKFALVAALFALPLSVSAQTVLVRVIGDDGGGPLVGAVTSLIDDSGRMVTNTLTDERGRALFAQMPEGILYFEPRR